MSPNADFSTPDRFPQIIKLASELEFNLGSEPIISCVATGNPLPTSDGVELRKADGTMLKVPQKPLPTAPCFHLAPIFWHCPCTQIAGSPTQWVTTPPSGNPGCHGG